MMIEGNQCTLGLFWQKDEIDLGYVRPRSLVGNTGKAEIMPLLQGWSWQMRKGPSSDRRDWKGLRLVASDGRPTPPDSGAPAEGRSLGEGAARLETNAQANIGSLLRAMYDSALHEPVPDRFLELLRQMETKSDTPAAPAPEQAE